MMLRGCFSAGCVLLVCASTLLASVERPVTVGYAARTQTPPKIDGVLDDACWVNSRPLTDYACARLDEFAPQKTIARICFDDTFLYFAFECQEDDMANLKVRRTGWALPWDEDSIEIFLDPDPRGNYFQYGANVLGANNIKRPEGQPEMVMTHGTKGEKAFYIEARVPWKNLKLDGPPVGDNFAMNMTRNRYRESEKINSSWSRIKGSFHQSVDFGQLRIVEEMPAIIVEKIKLGWKTDGPNVVIATLNNAGDQPETVQLNVGKNQAKAVIPAGQSQDITCLTEFLLGRSELSVTVASGDQKWFSAVLPVVSSSCPSWQKTLPALGTFRLVADPDVIFQGQPLPVRAESMLLIDAAGKAPKVSMQIEATLSDGRKFSEQSDSLTFTVPSEMPDGEIQLSLQLSVSDQGFGTLQRAVPVRGQFRRKCLDQLASSEGRLDELNFPEGSELADEVVYSRRKIDELRKITDTVTDSQVEVLRMQLPELSYSLFELKAGKLPVWGLRNITYTSSIDESKQPYVAVVPSSYDLEGDQVYPLFIFLHGYTSDKRWNPEGLLKPLEIASWKKGVISVMPWGRGAQWYRNDGETDIWDVLADVQRRYRIDPNRIYLGGFSMGGGGTQYLATSVPHRFAAIVPCSMSFDQNRLGNLLYIPAWLHCGGQEDCAPGMEKSTKKLNEQGTEALFTSDPASGHTTDFIDFPAVVDWLLLHRLKKSPKTILFLTDEPSHAQSYWARMEGLVDYSKPARMEINVEAQQIDVKAENVTTLTLNPPAQVIDLAKGVSVMLNGQPVEVQPDAEGKLVVTVTRQAAHDGPVKATGKPSGPVQDIFSRPFLVAYRSDDPAAHKAAENWCKTTWEGWHHGTMKARPDTEITEEELKTHGLFLFGSPTKSTPAQRALIHLPVKVQADRITLADCEAKGSDLALRILNVNAFAPDQYVLWVVGQQPKGVGLALKTVTNKMPGDFIIVKPDPKKSSESAKVLSGWFNADWVTIGQKE